MRVVRYRTGERRYLAVDAERYVPDRAAFAARHCDPATGVEPPRHHGTGRVHVDQGVSGPRGGPGVAADGGPPPRGAGVRSDGPPVGADGVLFLAGEPAFSPPRVVATLVDPGGDRVRCTTAAARCAARWVADGTGADRAMVDTQSGSRAARMHDDGSVTVEVAPGEQDPDPDAVERAAVVREFAVEVPETTR